ncbi:MAG: hypothetical protein Q8S32_17440 [Burkholderiaceae bacterium]|nr:hypothetical protein [Burkholderiaceae bacterium]
MKTCKDEKELQQRVALNLAAIKRTVPVIESAVEDDDTALAIEEIDNLLSQARGLEAMVAEAKQHGFTLSEVPS